MSDPSKPCEATAKDLPHAHAEKLLEDGRWASILSHVQQLRVIQRLKEATGAANGTGPCPIPDPRLRLSDFAFDLAKLHVETVRRALEISNTYADDFINLLRPLLPGTKPCPTVGATLYISAHSGDVARGRFDVCNRSRCKVTVGFSASEFVRANGGTPFGASVTFHSDPPVPDERVLAPGQTRTFALAVRLDRPFEAGYRYFASIYIAADGRLIETLPLAIDVEV